MWKKGLAQIYFVHLNFEAHPYVPRVSWLGIVGITSNSQATNKTLVLDSREYENFMESAKIFRNQCAAGMHKHITQFFYADMFHYDTIVYEINDIFFDAIYVDYSETDQNLHVKLVEPYTHRLDKLVYKDWKKIKDIDSDIFLKGSNEIEEIINQGLNWKKLYVGIIVYENQAVTFGRRESDEESPTTGNRYLAMPNFLDESYPSLENILSRMFEDRVADYLRSKYQYNAVSHFLFSYLPNAEIDVFAEKGISEKTVTLCECKLRLNNSPIIKSEIEKFSEKVRVIKFQESQLRQIKFYCWLVTNTDQVVDKAMDYAKKEGIEIRRAHLPMNWKNRSDWKVIDLFPLDS